MKTACLAVLALLLTASDVDAACSLSNFSVSGVTATYDPFEGSFAPVPISLDARTIGDCAGGRVQFALAPTPTSPQTGTQLVLNGQTDTLVGGIESAGGQGRRITNPATAFTGNQVSFPLGVSGVQSSGPLLRLILTPGQASPPGTYTALLNLLSRVTDKAGKQVENSVPLAVTVVVIPSVRLAAGSGDLYIDIGEIKPGVVGGPINFDAYANLGYTIVLKSENDFHLARLGHGSEHGGAPYVPLISNVAVTQDSSMDGAAGTRKIVFERPASNGLRHHIFGVRILPFTDLSAGDYSDLLTLEIRAKI
jgi:hypothetical protein